jgi:hypothetical protein
MVTSCLASTLRTALTHRQCQSLEDCSARSKDGKAKSSDDDVRYVSRYLEREYLVL